MQTSVVQVGASKPEQSSDAPTIDDVLAKHALKTDTIIWVGLLILVQAVFFVFSRAAPMHYGVNDFTSVAYSMFIHVSIMIFFGFGFLMTFLRRHGYSAVGLCVVVSCIAIQLSIVCSGCMKTWAFPSGANVNLNMLMNGLFCAGAVMISMGAVLGKVSPSQLLLMGIIETVVYWFNMGIYFYEFEAHDAAGGVVIHTFGAYFGLACARMVSNPVNLDHGDNKNIYSSDLFSLAGTLFLWLFWPSFCAAVPGLGGDGTLIFMSVTNTYMCLMGSVLGFAIVSRFLHGFQFDIVELQNATLAGGVAAGVPADYDLGPAGALSLGILAGVVSCLGYAKLDLGKIGLSDTCGVNNLHGMPGIISAIVGIAAFHEKAKDQILSFLVTLVLAIGGGLITGMALKMLPGGACRDDQYFNDNAFWNVPDDYKLE